MEHYDFRTIGSEIKSLCRLYDENLHRLASEYQPRFESLINKLGSIEGVNLTPFIRSLLLKNCLGSYGGSFSFQVQLNLEHIYSDFVRDMASLHLEDI